VKVKTTEILRDCPEGELRWTYPFAMRVNADGEPVGIDPDSRCKVSGNVAYALLVRRSGPVQFQPIGLLIAFEWDTSEVEDGDLWQVDGSAWKGVLRDEDVKATRTSPA